MHPWSKVDYSRVIREPSMAMEKLPEVDPPSDRVSGQGLLTAPIFKRRRQNREGIGKKGSTPRVFGARAIYRRWGAARGPPESPGALWARPRVGPIQEAAWPPGGSPL